MLLSTVEWRELIVVSCSSDEVMPTEERSLCRKESIFSGERLTRARLEEVAKDKAVAIVVW